MHNPQYTQSHSLTPTHRVFSDPPRERLATERHIIRTASRRDNIVPKSAENTHNITLKAPQARGILQPPPVPRHQPYKRIANGLPQLT